MSFTSDESRWADVYLVSGTRAVSVCGDFLAATTLALVLQQRGHGGLAVSGLLVAASLPLALLAPIGGRIADRFDSRTILVAAGLIQSLICVALAFVHQPVAIIGLVALLAAGLAVTQPTLAALIPQMVRPEDLPKASGFNQTAGVIGTLIAPPLAGVLLGQFGARPPLLIDAVSYLALVVAGLAVKTRRRPALTVQTEAAPFRVRDDRLLAIMIGTMAVVMAGVSAINVVEIFFIRDTLHASTTTYGLVSACWAAGMLIGSVLFGRVPRAWITVPVLFLIVAGTCLPAAVGALATSALMLVPLLLVGGIFNAGVNVFVMVIIVGRVRAAAHGRAFAALNGAVQLAGLIGLVAAGPLVERFDPRWLLASAAGIGLVVCLAAIPVARRTADKPSLASPQPRIVTPVTAQG
ncbi:MFS transporter [Paractinoplanes durhamensis]|uniref:MFS transporter n=1 Tax=Paractinoplanes durhamensis TaxID=113563 RepID=A0ABQ3Z140_9ACTN|nr:MFS transporter [Actinoplanes durhamensis]GIE03538.1 MFS transporter [Actinoplanes durhamensis]